MTWFGLCGVLMMTIPATAPDDPYHWLEEISGKRALEYVEAQNAHTLKLLDGLPEFSTIQSQVREILDSRDRIAYVQQWGDSLYNFWQDAEHPRGLWRRTTWEQYRRAEPHWETVLDVDALAKAENENWVWSRADGLPPDYRRCLVSLTRGGGDARVIREFDLVRREFVADGFKLPEAKSHVVWRDENTLYVGAFFGPGSLTDSGYPRQLKRWRRGTRLEDAPIVFEGQKTDVSVGAWVDHSPGFFREGFHREVAFFATDTFLLRNEHDAKALKIDVPRDAQVEFFRQFMTVQLRTPWTVSGTTYPAGALLAVPLDNFLQSNAAGKAFQMLFEPQPRQALQRITATRHALVLNVSDNVRGKVIELAPGTAGWQRREMRLPGQGTASASAVDGDRNDELWVHYQDFLTPPSLYHVMVGSDPAEPLKSLPALFDAGEMIVQQFEATSPDKTRVPYFVVGKREVIAAGSAPTILYGYGGFEIPLVPHYSGVVGRAWLERGGVYVLANIRGGGEFGPEWHQAAQKANRQRAFDDFEAVATDLVQRGITQTRHLGIMGGSNGGLLVSTVAIQRPELFHAVVCQVPLTDMRRFHKLLAGASWMAEYGDPDKPEDWAYLSKYSPYQNVRAQGKYPRMLLTTSTRDDRVHPAHARKLFAKMKDMGHDVLYFENTEGGHAGSANNQQRAKIAALEYTFFWNALR